MMELSQEQQNAIFEELLGVLKKTDLPCGTLNELVSFFPSWFACRVYAEPSRISREINGKTLTAVLQ
jgi:hypothetical protein